jgi:hypothetical protein
MPDPLEIRRLWFRLRIDDNGIHIGRRPVIAWNDVAAVGVGYAASSIIPSILLARGMMFLPLTRRCLHVCVRADQYPHPSRAVVFPPVGLRGRRASAAWSRRQVDRIRDVFGPWAQRVPEIVAPDDLDLWWNANQASHPRPRRPQPTTPTAHERASKIGDELHDLQDQLRRIQARKEHGHPPA